MAKKRRFFFGDALIGLALAGIGSLIFVQLVGIAASPVAIAVSLGVAFIVGGFWKRISD